LLSSSPSIEDASAKLHGHRATGRLVKLGQTGFDVPPRLFLLFVCDRGVGRKNVSSSLQIQERRLHGHLGIVRSKFTNLLRQLLYFRPVPRLGEQLRQE
jgi:hypothetical protein